jgi:putative phosphoribosyl transferase
MMSERFANRRQAGQQLALRLQPYGKNAVVLGLPRGGVEVAAEVARGLKAPLDLIIAQKVPSSFDQELAIGAVTETGVAVWNSNVRMVSRAYQKQAEVEARAEVGWRREQYLSGRTRIPLAGRVVVLVDDGMATGSTMQAAIAEVQDKRPQKIVVATPVAPLGSVDNLRDEVDNIVTLVNLELDSAVGYHYLDFPQLTDADVIRLLAEAE